MSQLFEYIPIDIWRIIYVFSPTATMMLMRTCQKGQDVWKRLVEVWKIRLKPSDQMTHKNMIRAIIDNNVILLKHMIEFNINPSALSDGFYSSSLYGNFEVSKLFYEKFGASATYGSKIFYVDIERVIFKICSIRDYRWLEWLFDNNIFPQEHIMEEVIKFYRMDDFYITTCDKLLTKYGNAEHSDKLIQFYESRKKRYSAETHP